MFLGGRAVFHSVNFACVQFSLLSIHSTEYTTMRLSSVGYTSCLVSWDVLKDFFKGGSHCK